MVLGIMRALPLVCLILLCSGCTHLGRDADPVIGRAMSADKTQHKSNYERASDMNGSALVKQRAAAYEREGLKPEEARAAAEIEYIKTGR